nr:hypothetical protein [Tanacetum cinerariifolium]
MGSIISTVSISPKGFLPSILLLVVVIVTVAIVAVIIVVVAVAIDRVVIVVMIIGLESLRFRGGNISFNTSSQMVKFVLHLLDVSSGTVLLCQKLLEFNPGACSGFLFVLPVFSMRAACASKVAATRSSIGCQMAA